MNSFYRLRWVITCMILIASLSYSLPARTAPVALDVPAGFVKIDSVIGAELYRKDYQARGSNPDFVQVVHLNEGASVVFPHGEIGDPGLGRGAYGGDSPLIQVQSLQEAWGDFSASNSEALCITNGQFFSEKDNPSELSFAIKKDGKILSDGSINGEKEYRGQKLMFEVWPDHADIVTLTKEALYQSSAPNILVGLTVDADKGPSVSKGRTFVGVDMDNNGLVLVFNSKTSKQEEAALVLKNFGADKSMMFDGGSSTQLICKGMAYIVSTRKIPQTIAVAGKPRPPLGMEVVRQPQWPILVEGEVLTIEVEVKNTGSETWRADTDSLVNLENPWGDNDSLSLPHDVQPGETVMFSWTTKSFSAWGVSTTKWTMMRGDEKFVGDAVEVHVVVIPEKLAEKKKELEEQIKKWVEEGAQNIEKLILEWIKSNIGCGGSIALFPLAALLAFHRARATSRKTLRNSRLPTDCA